MALAMHDVRAVTFVYCSAINVVVISHIARKGGMERASIKFDFTLAVLSTEW